MAHKSNEMAILKAVSVKLDPDTVLLLTFMYHTERQTGSSVILNANGKAPIDRTKSQYRYEGRIAKIKDIEAEIADAKAHPTDPWLWPGLNGWQISGTPASNRKDEARWLALKLKKAVDWSTAQKIFAGWKKSSNDYKDSRKYDLVGYTLPDGKAFELTPEAIKVAGCTTFSKICTSKKA